MTSEERSRGDHVGRLRRLGIPPAAAKAYLALIELGETEARDVARVSGVPFAKVYAALDQLHARGLAHVILDTPRRYAPKPVGDYLAALRTAQADRLRELDHEHAELETLLQIKPGAAGDDRGSFAMIRGRHGSIKRIAHLIQSAQTDIFILSTKNFLARAHLGTRIISDAHARGVRIRILAQHPPAETAQLMNALPEAEIRVVRPEEGAEHVAMLLTDRAQALIVHYVPDDADLKHGHDVGIYTSQRAVVRTLHSLLEARWNAMHALGQATANSLLTASSVPS